MDIALVYPDVSINKTNESIVMVLKKPQYDNLAAIKSQNFHSVLYSERCQKGSL